MGYVTAGRVVAMVEDFEPIWYRAVSQFPSHPMS
jgi:hypothetical protein